MGWHCLNTELESEWQACALPRHLGRYDSGLSRLLPACALLVPTLAVRPHLTSSRSSSSCWFLSASSRLKMDEASCAGVGHRAGSAKQEGGGQAQMLQPKARCGLCRVRWTLKFQALPPLLAAPAARPPPRGAAPARPRPPPPAPPPAEAARLQAAKQDTHWVACSAQAELRARNSSAPVIPKQPHTLSSACLADARCPAP